MQIFLLSPALKMFGNWVGTGTACFGEDCNRGAV